MRWPPYKHVIFDCDSTLTTVEGIDALAEATGKGWRISVLTDAAMSGEVGLEDIYAKRLLALKPTRGQINALREIYKQNTVQDAAEVIAALKFLGHQVYIISGGLADPVIEFGRFLGVPRENIRAVGVEYDQLAGEWWQQIDEKPNVSERFLTYDNVPLTISEGKAQIIQDLLTSQQGTSLLIGDGVSDLLASHAVDLFVGFGGVITRQRVRKEATIFIGSFTLAPLLAIAAGPAGLRRLEGTSFQYLLATISRLVAQDAIKFNSDDDKRKFDNAWKSAY